MSASCLASIWPPASPPKIKSATSPGMTRMITNTSAAAPIRVGTISRSRFATYVPIAISPRSGSVFRQLEVPGVASVHEPGRGLERTLLSLDADLPPFLNREHGEVLVRQLHVSVLEHDLEAVGIARLGQQPLGLGPVLLDVLPEPRKFL